MHMNAYIRIIKSMYVINVEKQVIEINNMLKKIIVPY
jgi:hypothetical protein